MKHKICIYFLFYFCFVSYGVTRQYRAFDNINKQETILSFFQDDLGLVWVGTNNGLSIYNESSLQKCHFADGQDLADKSTNCFLRIDAEHYYVGIKGGLVLFDIKNNTYALMDGTTSFDIRSMAWQDKHTVLLGTMNGLVRFDTKTKTSKIVKQIPLLPVYSIAEYQKGTFLISSYKGFYRYRHSENTYSFIPIPINAARSSLIISMAMDAHKDWLWIGLEGELLRYDFRQKKFDTKSALSNNSIKTILVQSNGSVWLGTDNGLYIYDSVSDKYEYVGHSSQKDNSLVNNVIWSIFEDKGKKIWLGTDRGISLLQNQQNFQTYRWEDLMKSDEGNSIVCIFFDSHDNHWFGGTNGLGRYNPQTHQYSWYKMKDSPYFISHNRVRSVYEDHDGDLWVATDGGINRFDYRRARFENYIIKDSSYMRNANWAYKINQDRQDNLWITSYMGGVFVVNKKKLLANGENKTYLAERNYYRHPGRNGLVSNGLLAASVDKDGNVWVTPKTRGGGLNKIDVKNGRTVYYSQKQSKNGLPDKAVGAILCDTEGFTWVGMPGALCSINPRTNAIKVYEDVRLQDKEILDMTQEGNRIWLVVSDGIFVFDKKTSVLRNFNIKSSQLNCIFWNKQNKKMLVGGIDQYICFSPDQLLKERVLNYPVVLTAVYLNDKPLCTGEEYGGSVILECNPAYTKEIYLKHDQNNLSFGFMNVECGPSVNVHYVYRLEGLEDEWKNMEAHSSRISYSSLLPGDYTLCIRGVDDKNQFTQSSYRLSIMVDAPWYACGFAKFLYLVLVLGTCLWVINYFRIKSRLRIEHIEREKTLELSNMKMDFLTNISHELKTPLSLIISPVSKLLSETKAPQVKSQLQVIHQNAMRLNTLIHQIIDFKDTNPVDKELHLSRLEMVEFVKSIINMHEDAMKMKNIRLEFHSDFDQLCMSVDVLKIESVVNNLISNAYKFTKADGIIRVELKQVAKDNDVDYSLCICVSDTGIGIPQKEIKHVLERYYQSQGNLSMNKDGSGIGLSLVKNYVELHHGQVEITSEEGQGTSVLVTLPVVNKDDQPLLEATDEENDEDIHKIKVLIVEDNIEIAHFLAENLKNANCTVAHNGKMGLEMAGKCQPDVIVADIMMPVMDGIEMSRLLKQNIYTATIPIIILTAKDDNKTETDAFSLGIEAFISKPFDINQLMLRIEKIVQSKKLLVSKLRQEAIVQEKEVTIESQDEKFLTSITEIIESNLANLDLNVQKLADISGYSSKQIYRRIKMLTGHTAVDYIKSIRLKTAAKLLAQKKFTVTEVMYLIGFSNSSYFSKCFSEKYGKTPKQYMESTTF